MIVVFDKRRIYWQCKHIEEKTLFLLLYDVKIYIEEYVVRRIAQDEKYTI